jgi:hypothetical protein
MKSITACAAALGAIMAMSSLAPAEAMPVPTQTASTTTDVQQARIVIREGYWRGHRGYRYARPGYRRYNGFWYPGVAFVTPGIVIRTGRGWCGPRWRRHRC